MTPFHLPRRFRLLVLPAALALTIASGCGTQGGAPLSLAGTTVTQTRVDAGIPPAADVDKLIEPYRSVLRETMDEVLAVCPVRMRTGKPEGLLGALVADIVLERARAASDLPVSGCVLNNGGLRIPWLPGEITLGLVYEVMPFDNEIVILRLSSEQMRDLADDIAAGGGEPVSGISFRIKAHAADGLRIGDEPVGSGDYWIATNDYLAGGGGRMEALWKPLEMRQTGVLVRDAIADALRRYERIPVPEMGRIGEAR